jgi:PAT family beta-lactamase induction signal transducer AmpG
MTEPSTSLRPPPPRLRPLDRSPAPQLGTDAARLCRAGQPAHAGLGFSAGLPLLLVLGTLSFWLREAGIDRTTIGYLSWVGLAYAFKWVWSPLVDRCRCRC